MSMEMSVFSDDAFAAFQAAADALQGEGKPILKFSKGKWLLGSDSEKLAIGTEIAANLIEAEWGWIYWRDGKPEERRMVRIATGQRPSMRIDLGHTDEDLWEDETDDNGNVTGKRDPWQKSFEFPVRELDGDLREMAIAGRSRGFEGAFKLLLGQFGREMRLNQGKTPVITLGADDYPHSDKQYGLIDYPVFKIVRWVDMEDDGEEVAAIEDQSGNNEETADDKKLQAKADAASDEHAEESAPKKKRAAF